MHASQAGRTHLRAAKTPPSLDAQAFVCRQYTSQERHKQWHLPVEMWLDINKNKHLAYTAVLAM
jgi:hypothetical protein